MTGGTAKPDVDVLFAQAGQLRSRRVKLLHLLARAQTKRLSEIKKRQQVW